MIDKENVNSSEATKIVKENIFSDEKICYEDLGGKKE